MFRKINQALNVIFIFRNKVPTHKHTTLGNSLYFLTVIERDLGIDIITFLNENLLQNLRKRLDSNWNKFQNMIV